MDLRERIVVAVESGMSLRVTADRFAVHVATVKRLKKQWQEKGHVRWATSPGRPPITDEADEVVVRQVLAQHPDAFLDELRQMAEEAGVVMSLTTVHNRLRAWGITRKKKPEGQRSRPT